MRKLVLLSILIFFFYSGFSQKIVSVSNPLEEYLQKNYDSTIILKTYEPKSNIVKLFIVSRKLDKNYNFSFTINNSSFQNFINKSDTNQMKKYLVFSDTKFLSEDLIDISWWRNSNTLWVNLQEHNIWNYFLGNIDSKINYLYKGNSDLNSLNNEIKLISKNKIFYVSSVENIVPYLKVILKIN